MSKEQFNSFSSLERKDFSSKIFQKTLLLSKEVVIKNAEEEVVALILSAIVGSIIERYNISNMFLVGVSLKVVYSNSTLLLNN